jgi:hypothetical protein
VVCCVGPPITNLLFCNLVGGCDDGGCDVGGCDEELPHCAYKQCQKNNNNNNKKII